MVGAVVIALFFWIVVFVVLSMAQGRSPIEYLLGRYEPLPDDLGTWRESGVAPSARQLREERWLLPDGRRDASFLLLQVRYRDRVTQDVVGVEPERRVPRRRLRDERA